MQLPTLLRRRLIPLIRWLAIGTGLTKSLLFTGVYRTRVIKVLSALLLISSLYMSAVTFNSFPLSGELNESLLILVFIFFFCLTMITVSMQTFKLRMKGRVLLRNGILLNLVVLAFLVSFGISEISIENAQTLKAVCLCLIVNSFLHNSILLLNTRDGN